MLATMDFDKTSFSVDWFTPADAAKRLSFPKSARISIDDLVSESPWSICFSSLDEVPQAQAYPIVHTPYDTASGRTTNAPPPFSPPAPPALAPPAMHTKPADDWRARASSGLLSVASDFAACGVDVDVTCLDGMDEYLLLSPMECLIEQCWETAVYEEVFAPVPIVHAQPTQTRNPGRSFRCNYEQALPISPAKAHPGGFERTRPLAAKISLPLEKFPHFLSAPSFEPYDTSLAYREKSVAGIDILYPDPETDPIHFPSQGVHTPRHSKKRDLILTSPSAESFSPLRPSKPSLESSKSSHTLRVLSDAYSSLTRQRKRYPH